MSTLDRYVSRAFLVAFLIFSTCLMGLYIAADAMFRLKDFSSGGELVLGEVLEHYLANGPLIFYRIAPFLVLMAAMFTVTRMSRLTELAPIQAAGISLYRAFAPIFAVAFIIALGLTAMKELYIPELAESIRESKSGKAMSPPLVRDREGNTFLANRYHVAEKRMNRVYVTHTGGGGVFHVKAREAAWEDGPDGVGWRVKDGRVFRYSGKQGEYDFEDLPEMGMLIKSSLLPVDVENTDKVAEYLSLGDLNELHRKNPTHAHLKVELHTRLAYPLTFLVLLLIGLPCVLILDTKNAFMGIGLCLGVCLIYIIVSLYFTDIGNRGDTISPVVAAWMPLVVFGTVGITLFDAIRT